MKLISVESLKPKDKIISPIISSQGRKILSENTELTDFYIQKIKEIGIRKIYIHDDILQENVPNFPISISTRFKAIEVYKRFTKLIFENKDINEDEIKKVASDIVDDIRTSGTPLIIDNSFYSPDDYLPLHAINTAILSVGIGMYLEYNYSQLCDIALAGLLHDIGREFDKDDTSSNHTQKGIELLRNTSVFSITCTAVAFQHHENYNGTGFPRQIKKDDISEFSRIVSVADYFDSLVLDDNNKQTTNEEAYNLILDNSDIKFDPNVVKAFKNAIQIYYNGMQVALNDGTCGIIVEQNVGRPLRPIVRIISDSNLKSSEDINLLNNIDKNIQSIIL